MPRTLTGAADTALQAATVAVLTFLQIELASGTLYLTTAAHNVSWNAQTWLGMGRLGQIEAIKEGIESEMYGVRMSLSGLPVSMISTALGEAYQGRPVKIWEGLVSGGAIVVDPIGPFTYRLDTMDIGLGDTATIELTAESRLVDWNRPRVRRYNDADQRSEYPEDRGMEFVEQMVDKELVWGRV